MDIYQYLRKDHRLVAGLMDQLLDTKSVADRKALFDQIKQELTIHADTEEATFYAELEKKKSNEEKLEHAEHEHDEIRELLESLSGLSIMDEKWMEQFGELKHAVTHHVEEEEEDIFEKAKKTISEKRAVELAKEMDALKQEQLQPA